MSVLRLLLLGGVGLVTGAINSVAGGGSLLSFPALLALGYSPLVANVTNTVGVFPTSAGGSLGYRRELAGQARKWLLLAAVCTAGSVLGAWLLLVLPASSFEAAVPVLIGTAALLTLAQPRLAKRMRDRGRQPSVRVGAAGAGSPAPARTPG
ncbi:MAG TPA: sulfite exporter TauE/SafE family protein, partial [Actinomycetes bacterium]|nr:sulfite exporter TauE/SafE family protein [Actinomycetes bacterium]